MHHNDWLVNENCPVWRTLEVVGERWTMLVLRESFYGVRRFDDFQRNIGVARNILSDRLSTLVEHGVLERHRYSDRPPRYEYRLTEKGLDLYPALVGLMQWGEKHSPLRRGPAVQLVHKECGEHSTPVLTCDVCGEPVHARAMRAEAGPGARKAKRA